MSSIAPWLLCLVTGCATSGFTPPWRKAETKFDGPKDNVVITERGMEREGVDAAGRQELDAAKHLFQEQKYAEAEKLFHKLAIPDSSTRWFHFDMFDQEHGPDPAGESPNMIAGVTPLRAGVKTSGKHRGKYAKAIYEEALFFEGECQRLQKNYRSGNTANPGDDGLHFRW